MVLSTKAHARIVSIDASPALAHPGVRAFFSAKDVPVNVGELFKVATLPFEPRLPLPPMLFWSCILAKPELGGGVR